MMSEQKVIEKGGTSNMEYEICPKCGKPKKPPDYDQNPWKYEPLMIVVLKKSP
jgi:hypothetical protein